MNKKEYLKPAMKVDNLLQLNIICSGHGAKSLNSTDDFIWTNGLDEDDV
jgi:hypothetical protein